MKRQVTSISEQQSASGRSFLFKTQSNPDGASVSWIKLQEDFRHVAGKVASSHGHISQDNLLQLYAWYKQALEGDAPAARPAALNIKARAKHDAWADVRGTSQPQAMLEYIMVAMPLLRV